jgi:tetratricopeptide (TPR) repeat protein
MIRKTTIGLITIMVMSSFFVSAQNRNELMAWEVQGDTLLDRGDFKGAAELFTKLIKKTTFTSREDYDLFYKRALALFQMDSFEAAIRDANFYKTKSGDGQGNVLKVYIYQKMGKMDDALTQIDTLKQLYAGNPELTKWKVQLLFDANRYEAAKAELNNALKGQNDPKLKLLLGLSHYYLDEFTEAFGVFDELINDDPTVMEAYIYPASLCLEDGHNEKALEYAEKGLRQDPADANLMFYKGVALHELDQHEDGCRFLAKAFYNGVDDAGDYLKEYCYGVDE